MYISPTISNSIYRLQEQEQETLLQALDKVRSATVDTSLLNSTSFTEGWVSAYNSGQNIYSAYQTLSSYHTSHSTDANLVTMRLQVSEPYTGMDIGVSAETVGNRHFVNVTGMRTTLLESIIDDISATPSTSNNVVTNFSALDALNEEIRLGSSAQTLRSNLVDTLYDLRTITEQPFSLSGAPSFSTFSLQDRVQAYMEAYIGQLSASSEAALITYPAIQDALIMSYAAAGESTINELIYELGSQTAVIKDVIATMNTIGQVLAGNPGNLLPQGITDTSEFTDSPNYFSNYQAQMQSDIATLNSILAEPQVADTDTFSSLVEQINNFLAHDSLTAYIDAEDLSGSDGAGVLGATWWNDQTVHTDYDNIVLTASSISEVMQMRLNEALVLYSQFYLSAASILSAISTTHSTLTTRIKK